MKIKEVTLSIDAKTAEILTIAMDKLSDDIYHTDEYEYMEDKELELFKEDIDKIWKKINSIHRFFRGDEENDNWTN